MIISAKLRTGSSRHDIFIIAIDRVKSHKTEQFLPSRSPQISNYDPTLSGPSATFCITISVMLVPSESRVTAASSDLKKYCFSTREMNCGSWIKNVAGAVGYLFHKVRGDAGSVNVTSRKFRLERRQVISRFADESSLFNSMTQHF
jgi:hypothetical protein